MQRRSIPVLPVLPVLLALLAATACGGDASTGGGLDDVPELALTEVFRAGSVDDPDAGFSRIGSVAVADDGTIYVYESQEREVRILSPTGEPLGRFGRSGNGPGEFGGTNNIGVFGDTVWAIQPAFMGASRVAFFDRDGEHLATHMVDASVRVPLRERYQLMMGPDEVLPGGRVALGRTVTIGGLPVEGELPATGDTVQVPRVIVDLEGNPVDTLGFDPHVVEGESPRGPTVKVEGRDVSVPRPPTGEPTVLPVADGRIIVHAAVPTGPGDGVVTFTHVGFGGDTLAHRELRYTPRPYAAAYLDTLAARYANSAGNTFTIVDGQPQRPKPLEDAEGARRAVRAAMDFGPLAPAVAPARVRADGTVWLQRLDDGGAMDRWILLDASGAPRGQVALPRGTSIPWASGNEILVVEEDDFDIPWLVKYTLGPGA